MPNPSTPIEGDTTPSEIYKIHYFKAWARAVPTFAKRIFHCSNKLIAYTKCKSCPRRDIECIECEYQMILTYSIAIQKFFKRSRNRRECPFSLHNRFIRAISFKALILFVSEYFPNSSKARHKLMDFQFQIQTGNPLTIFDHLHNVFTLYPAEQKEQQPYLQTLFILRYW